MRDKEGFRFDLITQRFLEQRWETPLGSKVLDEIIEGIQDSVEIRGISDRHMRQIILKTLIHTAIRTTHLTR